jgi:hypothetical protein
MGQYYKFIILANEKKNNKEVILLVINPHDFNEGAKIMEHSYINNNLMNTVEVLISKYGDFHKSRILWAGDYANKEDDDSDECMNLYDLASNYSSYNLQFNKMDFRYIVNHTNKLYVDKTKSNNIHPLPLLISEGNGKGGGDYSGNNAELCGIWSRDVISMEETIPNNYEELICDFDDN